MLQEALGIRKDVSIINIPLSYEKKYLERILKKKNIVIDYNSLKKKGIIINSEKQKSFSIHLYVQELCRMITNSKPEIPVYFALTVYKQNFNTIKDDLYIIGLAYRYSTKNINNLAILQKNLEENFRLDYIQYDWYNEEYPGKNNMATIHSNYVAPMVMLAEHYKLAGQNSNALKWKNKALDLAKTADNEYLVKYIEDKNL